MFSSLFSTLLLCFLLLYLSFSIRMCLFSFMDARYTIYVFIFILFFSLCFFFRLCFAFFFLSFACFRLVITLQTRIYCYIRTYTNILFTQKRLFFTHGKHGTHCHCCICNACSFYIYICMPYMCFVCNVWRFHL